MNIENRTETDTHASILPLALRMASDMYIFEILNTYPLRNDTDTLHVINDVWNKIITTIDVSTNEYKISADDTKSAITMLCDHTTLDILNTLEQNHIEAEYTIKDLSVFVKCMFQMVPLCYDTDLYYPNILVSKNIYDDILKNSGSDIDITYTENVNTNLCIYYGGTISSEKIPIYVVNDRVDQNHFFENNIMIAYKNKGKFCKNGNILDNINGIIYAPYQLIDINNDGTYSTKYALVKLGEHPENNYVSIKIDLDNK